MSKSLVSRLLGWLLPSRRRNDEDRWELPPYDGGRNLKLLSSDVRGEVLELLATMVTDGLKLQSALLNLQQMYLTNGHSPTSHIIRTLTHWSYASAGGRSFHEAAAKSLGNSELLILQSGESADHLRAAAALATQQNGFLAAAMLAAEPALTLTVMSLGYMWFQVLAVFPDLIPFVPLSQWRGFGAGLAVLVVLHPILVTLVTAAVPTLSLWGFIYATSRLTGPTREWLDRHEPFASYRRIQAGPFLLALSSLIESNIQPQDALAMLKQTANPWLTDKIDKIIHAMQQRNMSIGRAIERTGGVFPDPLLASRLVVLADHAGFPVALKRLAVDFMKDNDASLQNRMSRAGNWLFMFMALPLGALMLAFNVPFNQLNALGAGGP